MTIPSGSPDEHPDDWVFSRYRVALRGLMGERFVYGVYTRCGEHKAVALALRNHLLGRHGFFEDFPLMVDVEKVDGEFSAADLVEMEDSELGDLNEG